MSRVFRVFRRVLHEAGQATVPVTSGTTAEAPLKGEDMGLIATFQASCLQCGRVNLGMPTEWRPLRMLCSGPCKRHTLHDADTIRPTIKKG
jgi:hypothetical protein